MKAPSYDDAAGAAREGIASIAAQEGTRSGGTFEQINGLVIDLATVFAKLSVKLDALIEALEDRKSKRGKGSPPDSRGLGPVTPWAMGGWQQRTGTGDQPWIPGYSWDEWERRKKEWLRRFGR